MQRVGFNICKNQMFLNIAYHKLLTQCGFFIVSLLIMASAASACPPGAGFFVSNGHGICMSNSKTVAECLVIIYKLDPVPRIPYMKVMEVGHDPTRDQEPVRLLRGVP